MMQIKWGELAVDAITEVIFVLFDAIIVMIAFSVIAPALHCSPFSYGQAFMAAYLLRYMRKMKGKPDEDRSYLR